MREKPDMRNCVLQQAKENAMKASHARASFQMVMNNGMRRPMHYILCLLSIFQDEKASSDQKIIVDTMVKTSTIISKLINDAMEIYAKDDGRVVLETGVEGGNDKVRGTRRPSTTDENVTIKFEIEVSLEGSQSDSSNSTIHFGGRRHNNKEVTEGLSFIMCKKLVQVGMNGVMRKLVLAGELQRLLQSGGGDSEAWNKFHTRHSSGKFFKEWRYLLKAFPELASCGECLTVLEVGCGNGSTALPILRGNKSISLYACDCSEEALERAKENIEAANSALLAVKVSSRSRICAPQMQEAAVRKISPMQRYLPRTIAALGSRFCYLNIYAISSATSQDVESNHRMLLCSKARRAVVI
ncbi:hypothetical protein K7X08_021605 [Anisodus acutangulus]|uniref:Methyltransferase domain-containing protein n=1 Tax=Anisodus acutangulus TaxID=402998 RepID=A0A9Q1REI6_9SOLA|nr:hypothetical protein K7X08_021605 [Anisodus acutangulus]